MKKTEFNIYGHPNILSLHYNTIEFTKESDLTRKGDCIVGVKADFDSNSLNKIIKEFSKVKITIRIGSQEEVILAEINKEFSDPNEIVIRKSDFNSKRTFAIKADKAAKDLNRRLIEKLKNSNCAAKVEIVGLT